MKENGIVYRKKITLYKKSILGNALTSILKFSLAVAILIVIALPAIAVKLETDSGDAADAFRIDDLVIENSNEINGRDNRDVLINYGSTGDVILAQGGGNVGIGTMSPRSTLEVSSSDDTSTIRIASPLADVGKYNGIHLGRTNADYSYGGIFFERIDNNIFGKLHFALQQTPGGGDVDLTDSKLTINYNGNVGITALSGTGNRCVYADSNGVLGVKSEDCGGGGGGGLWSQSGSDIYYNSGEVGIGTYTPNAKLTVDESSDANGIISIDSGSSSAQYSAVEFYDMGSNTWGVGKDQNNDFYIDEYGVANRLFIQKGTGRVGIGTMSPGEELEVVGDVRLGFGAGMANDYGKSLYFSTDATPVDVSAVRMKEHTTDNYGLEFQTYSSGLGTRMTILGNGNVGIGTTSPARKLQVGSTIAPGVNSDQDADILSSGGIMMAGNKWLSFDDGYAVHGKMRYNSQQVGNEIAMELNSYYGFNFMRRGGTSAMVIKGDTGNVGIGTTSPQVELHIHDEGGLSDIRLSGTAAGADTFEIQQGITGVSNPGFSIYDVEATASRLVIDTNGNVGIGTTSPGRLLQVGSGSIGGSADPNANIYSTGGVMIQNGRMLSLDQNYYTHAYEMFQGATGEKGFLQHGYYGHEFTTRQGSAMVIRGDTNNVGIGTASPSQKLDVNGQIHATGDICTDVGGVCLSSGGGGGSGDGHSLDAADGSPVDAVYVDNAGKVGIGTTNPGSYALNIYTGDLNLGNINGHSIAWAESNTVIRGGTNYLLFKVNNVNSQYIDSSGRVGIGTTSPSEKLHVVGNIYKTGTVSFVQDHPTDHSKMIVYVSLEGGEAGTYVRGEGRLVNGEAEIELPEDFTLVTTDGIGLTTQITPLDECNGIRIVQISNSKLVVKELNNGKSSARFYYTVNGIRKGYEDYNPMKDKV